MTAPQFPPPRRWVPPVMLVTLGLIWGAVFSLSKLALGEGIHPLGYAFWQALGPLVSLLILLLVLRRRLPVTPRHLVYFFFTGLTGVVLPNLNFFYVITHIPAGLMAMLVPVAPLFTYLFALLMVMEKFFWLRLWGIVMGLGGTLVLIFPRVVTGSLDLDGWALLGVVTPLLYALNNIIIARYRPADLDSIAAAAGMMAASLVMLTPLVFLTGTFYLLSPPFSPGDWALLAHMAVSSLAYALMYETIKLAGPVFFSQVGYLVTLCGVLVGWLFFAEELALSAYGAAGVILFGLYLVNRRAGAR